ncbi:Auxilin-related protein 2 [Abeliophyllum distichum]|uniref:Auxilin-related protein 2 n=1 Tax=Abeliophyllum distichum TaxID=126358 RepID=A0ABD1Q4S3_9LAMI
MDDLDVLARDFGFRPQGKSNPMRSDQADRRPARSVDDQNRDGLLFNDVFGGPPKYTSSSSSNNNSSSNKPSSLNDFDYDSIFKSDSKISNSNSGGNKTSSLPVYDKPVYDDDIFDGLPGLKSKLGTSSVRFEDDVFASIASPPSTKSTKSRRNQNDFDDLLVNLGGNDKFGESNKSSSAKSSSTSQGFDDLLPGFGSGIPASSNRPVPESSQGSIPTGNTTSNVMEDPFVVMESTSTPGSSSGVFTDPLEEISKLGKSRSARAEASSVSDGVFDDLDPLNGFGRPVHPFSPGRDNGGKDGSPSRSGTPVSSSVREQTGKSSYRYSESNVEKKVPVDNFEEPPLFDVPDDSSYSHKSFGQTAPPPYYETTSQVDVSQLTEEQGQQSDDVWLSVLEIPLFTQPSSAPPPSRPPPPIPHRTSKSETGSFSSNLRKKGDAFSSSRSYNQYTQSPKLAQPAAKSPPVSQSEELDDFAMGRSHFSVDESANFHASEDYNVTSAAAASAAAMKEAMDKAEAKFRHAKEVREREYAKTARSKDSVLLEKDGQQDELEREFRENQDKLERERKQAEEEEREQRRLERERERERVKQIERERARQAVERATREARERAAAEARERAATDARSKAERAAVDKVNAETRGRAERAAVQRAQAEARERAAVEARERAEKAAAEARERSASEEREKEAREKAAVARAEAEARRRAERAAVDRAAAEARERAAAEAREKAAAAAKMSQQKNDDDLESFFSMGSRASSVPRARADSVDPMFNQQFQNKAGSEAAKRTSSSSGASNMRKASSTTNIVDDLSSIFGAAESSGTFQDVEGETEERRRARLERHQRTQERAAKALAEKNQRDLQAQRDQEERHRIAETLDIEIKRWAAGKEGNLRALLSTMQYVLWPECGWQPVSLTDLITGASVKKVYRKATLCIHPDKVQQKGATLQQKYIAEKVFDLLKEAWNKFNSEELF